MRAPVGMMLADHQINLSIWANGVQGAADAEEGSEKVDGVEQAPQWGRLSHRCRTSIVVIDEQGRFQEEDFFPPTASHSSSQPTELSGLCAVTTLTSAGEARCWPFWKISRVGPRVPFWSSKTGNIRTNARTVAFRAACKARFHCPYWSLSLSRGREASCVCLQDFYLGNCCWWLLLDKNSNERLLEYHCAHSSLANRPCRY